MPDSHFHLLRIRISMERTLAKLYMPYIAQGGIFVPQRKVDVNLADCVFLTVSLLNEPTPYAVLCKVVWLTPGAQAARQKSGIGLQILGSDGRLRAAIETHLLTAKLSHDVSIAL